MRNILLAGLATAAIGTLSGCATPDEVAQKQIAYFGPACKKLGYTSKEDIARCVNSKVDENSYFWAMQPSGADFNNQRVSTPVPPEPPKRVQE